MLKNRILIVTECFYPEEFKINDIAIRWKKKGYEVDILTLVPTYPFGKVFDGYKNKFLAIDYYEGLKIYRFRAVTGYKNSIFKKIIKYINFMFLASLFAIFYGRKYDYVFGFNMSSLTNMFPAVLIRKLYSKPLTLWVQDLWPDSVYAYGFKKTKFLSIILDTFVRFIYSNVSSVAISGKGFEQKLKQYFDYSIKFNYLPNWADDLSKNSKKIKLSSKELIQFTFAGNIGKVQNLENVINAFLLIPSKFRAKAQLNIIGDGSHLENLKSVARGNPEVVFHGKKKREDIYSYFDASDFLIISLIDKPIFSVLVPAKTQTYIAAKKPILAFINGDTADIVKSNNLGQYANPSNLVDMTNVFVMFIQMSHEKRKEFTINNDYLLDTIFNKNKTIDKLLEIVIEKV